ncbi:MAG: molybdopterin molybdotransferase MoeA [Nitrososphaeria archaeon]
MTRPLKLITYEMAMELVKSSLSSSRVMDERVRVDRAIGRASAETVIAPVDVPQTERSAMDGYAILSEQTHNATVQSPARFKIAGKVLPGLKAPPLKTDEAYYVSLGSEIPQGADAVVKVEDVRVDGEYIELRREIQRGKNVILRGEDFSKGYTIIESGQQVTAAHAAMLIASGINYIRAFRMPRVGILSVGDELRELDDCAEGAIVNTYRYLVADYLNGINAVPLPMGTVKGSKDEIAQRISEMLGDLDAVITLGGSSVGDNDNTYDGVLQCSGARAVYHGIELLPVKPTGLILIGSKPIMVLPGQAVSSTISFFLTAVPVIGMLTGMKPDSKTISAIMNDDLVNSHELDAVRLIRLVSESNGLHAEPLKWGMNILSNLPLAGGFLRLKPREKVKRGDVVNVTVLGVHGFSNISTGMKV